MLEHGGEIRKMKDELGEAMGPPRVFAQGSD